MMRVAIIIIAAGMLAGCNDTLMVTPDYRYGDPIPRPQKIGTYRTKQQCEDAGRRLSDQVASWSCI